MADLKPQGQPRAQRKLHPKSKHLTRHASTTTSAYPNNASNTTKDVQSVTLELEVDSMALEPLQPRIQSQRPPSLQSDLPWRLSIAPNTLPSSGSNAAEGAKSFTQFFGTALVVNEQAIRLASQSPLASSVSKQALSRPSKPGSAKAKNKSPQHKVVVGDSRDEKVDPSPDSGGIPNVSNEYLNASLSDPSQLGQPQHLLVVIDLNGTLLYRPNRKNPTKFLMRPHAQSFLKYCVDTFKVVIWSSARPENVAAMCGTILTPDIKRRVVAIWGRDKFGLSKTDFNLRVQCYKRLSQVWQDEKISRSHPLYREGHRWDQTNTVLIDDSREKARTEPHNLIEVPEWYGDLKERDDILPQVHDYLNHLSMNSNISACLRSHPWQPTVF
ncbi:hypothetical protein D0Z07_5415 [Hyphodiscus hymeniophilus]|uniref:Mitochondrial import inner membrane translocase subunit TIM50 n=1 Tax=Hyphodiscus hymeniophilus TaxID=353542 RepID=A0A9P7AWC8_9HELO|nr:hypothetical protein D0Z07_5415 [Hyphodiscus hymeniophilus]